MFNRTGLRMPESIDDLEFDRVKGNFHSAPRLTDRIPPPHITRMREDIV